MSLYSRLKSGEQPDWRWLFCESCKQEWLAPDIADAIPGFCPHCREPIDPTLQPDQVLDDVEELPEKPELYYHNGPPVQRTSIEISPETQVRIRPISEPVTHDDKECLAIGHEITLLVNQTTMMTVRMSHFSFHKYVSTLKDYMNTCGLIMDHGHSLMGAQLLKQFNGYFDIGGQDEL